MSAIATVPHVPMNAAPTQGVQPTSMLLRLALLIFFTTWSAAAAVHWPLDLYVEPDTKQAFALDPIAVNMGDRIVLEADWSQLSQLAWLECCLVTNDGRFFATAMPLPADPERTGKLSIRFSPEAWSGPDGLLDDDALAGAQELWVRSFGIASKVGHLTGRVQLEQGTTESEPRIQVLGGGVQDRGPWRELQVRLLGVQGDDPRRVDLVRADGGSIPAFPQRRLAPQLGRVHIRGPSMWCVRLRPDEVIASGWRLRTETWTSPPMPALRTVPGAPLATGVAPLTRATPSRHGQLVVAKPGDDAERQEVNAEPALAPFLIWRADWTHYRGTALLAHQPAAALDAAVAAGATAIDLLPQSLFEEHGSFRFGLSPWHVSVKGGWTWPSDLYANSDAHADLLWHARNVVARCRAAPSLQQWRVSCKVPATGEDDRRALTQLITSVRDLLRDDPRPLIIDHPQAVPYDPRRRDERPWLDFENHTDGFASLSGQAAVREQGEASSNRAALRVTCADDRPAVLDLVRSLDANVFNLDRLEFDVQLTAKSGALQLFAWVTDEQHRWYQQRLDLIAANAPWCSVGIDFSPYATWQPVGHTTPWDGTQRRRIRHIGIQGYGHQLSPDSTVRLDRFMRFGWPAEPFPALKILDLDASTTRLSCFETLDVSFDLNQRSANPYDPDMIDVVGEIESPEGTVTVHPAYWYEAVSFAPDAKGIERATRSDEGEWRWHFAPPTPGTWRWRIKARFEYRGTWLEKESTWQALNVEPAKRDALLPIRASKDPRYWERSDGSWFYPIGINLRSPGDERQDGALEDAGSPLRSIHWEHQGTVAYEHWFDVMHQHGMNYARVWMAPWWCGIEWTRAWDGFGGLTWYNQIHAAQLDRVMAMARKHKVYVQLELQNHGMTAPRVDSQWADSPYNGRQGGPAQRAKDFFTSEVAWNAHRKRLRYTVARWGHNSHLMAWVLSSEMEFTGAWWDEAYRDEDNGHSVTTERWINRSLDLLEQLDTTARPVSVHFSHPWRAGRLWRETKRLAFANSNAYTGFTQIAGQSRRLDLALQVYLDQKFPPWTLNRPTMIGEWGGHWMEKSDALLRAELRTGVWMQAVTPYGGNVGFWWWLWLDATDTWDAYAAVAAFTADEDPRGHNFRTRNVVVEGASARMLGMAGTDQHRYYAWRVGASRRPNLSALKNGGTARIRTGAADTAWRITRFNCTTGTATADAVLRSDASGDILLPIGPLDPDTAFKLDRVTGTPSTTTVPWE